mmetsp:Transcript_29291/g.32924  ORF Transcript_29291/g.32924 Transcript_29291/m.32924 type:complete len:95 (+) Transcript_29291:44-328(+)
MDGHTTLFPQICWAELIGEPMDTTCPSYLLRVRTNGVVVTIILSWGCVVRTGYSGDPVVCMCVVINDGYEYLPIIRVFRGGKAGYNVDAQCVRV